ncbi:MAG TPA: enoyl-CoA hydratase-related protein [Actinomycetota bacterium]|nr:enoyl-CoA hydratase-related protein [Actinomycetota bacterium]
MPCRYEESNGVAVLTLDRPDVLNAFDDELGNETLAAVRRASDDASVRCIVITGAGRAFSSGEDLGALQADYESGQAPPLGNTLVNRYNPLIRAVRAAPKPVLAAINGVAAGAGASLALACDFRIASEKAKLVLAFVKVGLVPDSGAVWFLTHMVGSARAWKLAATGDPLGAEEALALGVVDRVVSLDEFDGAWRSYAEELAAGPTRAYALTKELVNAATHVPLDEQLDLEVDAQTAAGATSDHLEGVQAFLGKRRAEFKGL